MKDLFFRFCRWALPFFGVSAVVSCDNVFNTPDMYGTQVAEYGVPVMEYVVKGKVMDSEFNPIENIAVRLEGSDGYVATRTSSEGSFLCEGVVTNPVIEELVFRFIDTDGSDNGGEFQEKVVSVPLSENGSLTTESIAVVMDKK